MNFKVVIPARYESTRLPGKPLLDLGGQSMISRVVSQALASEASEVVVATDDVRVRSAVDGTHAQCCMTSSDHQSGSDRIMEVVSKLKWNESTVIVNVQGDEPLIPPVVIDQVANLLSESPSVDVATLSEPIILRKDVFDPNITKVVVNSSGEAMYFSRAPIPWKRGDFDSGIEGPLDGNYLRHIGLYAYTVSALRRFVNFPESSIEGIEKLEQMRFIENGISIRVASAIAPVPGGVDTEADVERVKAILGE